MQSTIKIDKMKRQKPTHGLKGEYGSETLAKQTSKNKRQQRKLREFALNYSN